MEPNVKMSELRCDACGKDVQRVIVTLPDLFRCPPCRAVNAPRSQLAKLPLLKARSAR